MLPELTPVHIPLDEHYISQIKDENVTLRGHTKDLATRVHSSARLENVAKRRAAAQVAEYKRAHHEWKKKYNALKRRVSEVHDG